MRAETFKGMHGYDPERVPGVRAAFYAWGAEIRAGATPQAMRTVDVRPTVTYLLGIESGAPVDGRPHPEIATRLG